MKFLIKIFTAISILGCTSVYATPVVVDFSSGSFVKNGVIDTSHDVTFSRDLYSHSDGFMDYDGGAYNWYGERGESISFSNLVSLTSIDFSRVSFGLTYVDSMEVTVFDGSNSLIDTVLFDLTSSLQTVAFELDNVSKVVFDWVGQGGNNYNDGRDHNWYLMDNIRYDTDNNLYPSADVPAPAPLALLALGLVGLGFARKMKKV